MKLISLLGIFLLLINCSFDNKSGIWSGNNNNAKSDTTFKDFKRITITSEIFNKTKNLDQKFNFITSKPLLNRSWSDALYGKSNNIENLKYDNLNNSFLKTKKLSRHKSSNYILHENDNLILSNDNGDVIIYSLIDKLIISKFNFYKKRYKKIKKNLNFIVEKNKIYISDNIGYIYAYNFIEDKVIWAKNYKIPFRSNIKLFSDKIVTSNQNNDLFILYKETGKLIKKIPSEETKINNDFVNNIALSKDEIFYLNTYGSLYSINMDDLKSKWYINLNRSADITLSNLFLGSKISYYKNNVLLSSNENFYIIKSKTGSIVSKKNFSSSLRPLIYNDYVFLITKNNFLIVMKLSDGEIIYSYDIPKRLAEFIGEKEDLLDIKSFIIANNNILIFLNNYYIIKFNIKGEIIDVMKLPSKLNSNPIIVNNSLFFLNNKNNLYIVN